MSRSCCCRLGLESKALAIGLSLLLSPQFFSDGFPLAGCFEQGLLGGSLSGKRPGYGLVQVLKIAATARQSKAEHGP